MPVLQGGQYFDREASVDARWLTCTPAAPSNTYVLSTPVVLPTSGTTTINAVTQAGFVQPDMPRNITVVGNQASVAGSVVLTGFDINDDPITETLILNGTTAVVGNKAFKYISTIVVPARAAASDSVTFGIGSKLGLETFIRINTVWKAWLNGTVESTAPTVTVDANGVVSNCTVTLNSSLPGGQVVDVIYFSK